MEYTHLLLRYGELFLKGQNRGFFERILQTNIQKITAKTKIKKLPGRLILEYFPAHSVLKKVFGITSYSPAVRVEKNPKMIQEAAVLLLGEKKSTFRIETRRADKSFPLPSPEMNIMIGKYVEENTALTFSRANPEIIVGIEINHGGAFLFTETISCFGGLPTGVEGKALLLVENEASLLAGLLAMKRGCFIVPVSLGMKKNFPEISLLQPFSPVLLNLENFPDFRTLGSFAEKENFTALVSGQNFGHFKTIPTDLVVFRPLIAYTDEEVESELNCFQV